MSGLHLPAEHAEALRGCRFVGTPQPERGKALLCSSYFLLTLQPGPNPLRLAPSLQQQIQVQLAGELRKGGWAPESGCREEYLEGGVGVFQILPVLHLPHGPLPQKDETGSILPFLRHGLNVVPFSATSRPCRYCLKPCGFASPPPPQPLCSARRGHQPAWVGRRCSPKRRPRALTGNY